MKPFSTQPWSRSDFLSIFLSLLMPYVYFLNPFLYLKFFRSSPHFCASISFHHFFSFLFNSAIILFFSIQFPSVIFFFHILALFPSFLQFSSFFFTLSVSLFTYFYYFTFPFIDFAFSRFPLSFFLSFCRFISNQLLSWNESENPHLPHLRLLSLLFLSSSTLFSLSLSTSSLYNPHPTLFFLSLTRMQTIKNKGTHFQL